MEPERKSWNDEPPTECDVCHEPIEEAFVDGKTDGGPWGTLCVPCHETHGEGLGPGLGQLYERDGEEFVEVDPSSAGT
jgi:hypothetical protein